MSRALHNYLKDSVPGTPFFIYDMGLLKDTLSELHKASKPGDYKIQYALKANSNRESLERRAASGLGADCVSGPEIERAMETGFTASKIAFAGVGKTDEEILTGLGAGIFSFNCESAEEIKVISELAGREGKVAPIALRINPNVNANTHKYITTGLEENKFCINPWEFDAVCEVIKNSGNVSLKGLHFHIGSQINDLEPFRNLCLRANEMWSFFSGKGFELNHLNLGGGLGIDYQDPDANPIPGFTAFFDTFRKFLYTVPGREVHFELGRSIVGQCGTLVSRVVFVKKGINTHFIILDAGMTELIRPALYQSIHKIENYSAVASGRKNENEVKYDVVGPICESSDCFGKALTLPETFRNDIILIRSAGAYGEVMSSAYNLRKKAPAYYF